MTSKKGGARSICTVAPKWSLLLLDHFDTRQTFPLLIFQTDWLTPWRRVLLGKPTTVAQPLQKFPKCLESVGSLPSSQEPAADLYPEPDESTSYPQPISLLIHLNIILPFTSRSSYWPLSFRFCYQNPACTPVPNQLLFHWIWRQQLYRQQHANAPRLFSSIQ
jgi:hypothetical protein